MQVIKPLLKQATSVLEIGSGTGQHAVYFAKRLPHLIWHTSDAVEHHVGIKHWCSESDLVNIVNPIAFKVTEDQPPVLKIDAIFSANTAHIMSWYEVESMMQVAAGLLPKNGLFILYGPFNYQEKYTSASNAQFDIWLKNRHPQSCIKDFEKLNQWAEDNHLFLKEDCAMPENNRILVWQKASG